jgi:hypothetical protein
MIDLQEMNNSGRMSAGYLFPRQPMDRLPLHPLHYTPVNGGAKWNSNFSAA